MEDVQKTTEEKMKQAMEALKKQFLTMRSGKASAGLVENVKVNYYDEAKSLNQLANITCPEARVILISPWDKSALADIFHATLVHAVAAVYSNH